MQPVELHEVAASERRPRSLHASRKLVLRAQQRLDVQHGKSELPYQQSVPFARVTWQNNFAYIWRDGSWTKLPVLSICGEKGGGASGHSL